MTNPAVRFAFAALAMCLVCALGACESGSGTKEVAAKKVAEATAVPATAAPLAADAPADQGEEPFEDDLVLLAEGDPDWGEAPLTVKFRVESLIMDQMNEPKFTWTFGDDSAESHEATPVHTFEKPGNYAVTIKVVDATGETGWDELDVEVVEPGRGQGEREAPEDPSAGQG